MIQRGLRLSNRSYPKLRQDIFADEIDDVRKASNKACAAMEPHQRPQAKITILVIVDFRQLRIERIAHGSIIAGVVTSDSEELGCNVELVEHR